MSFLIGEASNYAGLNVLLTVCALVVSLICAFGVFWLSQRASERDRQRHEEQVLQKRKEDQWATAIDSLKQKLDGASLEGKQLAEKLIDERLRAASHEVNNHVQGFVTGMELLKSQMNEWGSGRQGAGQGRNGKSAFDGESARALEGLDARHVRGQDGSENHRRAHARA
jgi:hypothetical protein